MRKKDPESEVERKRQSYDFSVSKYSEAKIRRDINGDGEQERAKVVNLERRTEKQSARQTENDSFILTDE